MTKNELELTSGIATLALAAVSAILFFLSYTTGYYTLGQMNSTLTAVLLFAGIAVEVAALILRLKKPDALWPKFLTFGVTALLAAAAMLLVGDRVEGIGNCIVTDYDSGHGGEEAIYLSIACAVLLLIAVIYNIIGSFSRDKTEPSPKNRRIARSAGFGVSAAVVLLAVLVPTYSMVHQSPSGETVAAGGTETSAGSTYSISYGQENGNAEDIPDYQFSCSNLGGMVRADSRFYIDITLTLDGNGNYTLFSDAYVIESGKRAEIGDDTGLGMILTTNAEGTYTADSDGNVTTSVPVHAVFEMETDTYSAQMKDPFQLNVNGNDADGVYDSDEEPAVLDFVPETVWTLEGDKIVSYYNPNAESVTEETEGTEGGEPVMTGDGLTVTSEDGGTTFTFYADGTYVFAFEAYNVEDAGTYTYENGKLTVTNANGDSVEAEGDPLSFHYVSAASDQLTGDFSVSAADLEALLGGSAEGGETGGDALTVTSEDGATTFTFNPDGTCVFAFEAYGVEDAGTYTYENGKLTVTNANGDSVEAEGDPLSFHYVSAVSDQLTGDFSVSASELP